ncbi:MAG: BsuPI-related putative proteinase inhibitor, partial [Myxococcaceae bacterium]
MVGNRVFAVVLALVVTGCGVDSEGVVTVDADTDEAVLGAELGANDAAKWFPMSQGNQWVFGSPGGTRTVEVTWAYGSSRHVTGLVAEGGQWLGYGASNHNTLSAWSQESYTWSAFIRFGYAVTPWRYDLSESACQRFIARRSATGVTVQTPAGTFANARSIAFDLDAPSNVRCAAPYFRELTFVAGVGPVKVVSGAGEVFLLQSAKVGAKLIAAPLWAKVTSDKAVYLNQANTIRCITTPCPGNGVTAQAVFTLTVTNRGAASKTWHFSSGHQFDFEVLDASGAVVRAWSD